MDESDPKPNTQLAKPPVIPLGYAPRDDQSRRRVIKWSVVLAVLVSASVIGRRYGPHAWLFAQQYYWERQCMNFNPPADQVVYDRLPNGSRAGPSVVVPYMDDRSPEAVALDPRGISLRNMADSASLAPDEVFRVPDCWVRFLDSTRNIPVKLPWSNLSAVVFCHERVSPGGHTRLVTVAYPGGLSYGDVLASELGAQVYAQAGWNGTPQLGRHTFDFSSVLRVLQMPRRVFAGQLDPADASRFWIEYEWPSGDRGFVDGRLNDDESVTLSIRPGPGDVSSERKIVFGGH